MGNGGRWMPAPTAAGEACRSRKGGWWWGWWWGWEREVQEEVLDRLGEDEDEAGGMVSCSTE